MRNRLKWFFIGLVGFYLVFGFFILPLIIEKKLPDIVDEVTKGHFQVENVSFNPLINRLDIYGIRLADPEGQELFGMERGTVNVGVLSLLAGKIHFEKITLYKPCVDLVQYKDGSFNFDWLTQQDASESEATQTSGDKSALPRIVVDTFALVEGKVSYEDLTKKDPFGIALVPIGFTVKNIDTAKIDNSDDTIRFYTAVSDGGFLDIKSEILSLEPFAIKGSVDYYSGELYTEWRYLKEQFELEVADGKMSLQLDFSVDTAKIDDMRIENLQFALQKLRVKPKAEHKDVLRVGLIGIENGVIEPLKQRVEIGTVRVEDVTLLAKRDTDGVVDWQRYTAAKQVEVKEKTEKKAEDTPSLPWLFTLDHFAMQKIKASFYDAAVSPNVMTTLDDLALDMLHVSSKPSTPLDYNLTMLVNGKMSCQSEGSVEHSPLDITAASGCKAIDLTWFRPYIDQAAYKALKKFDIALTHGIVAFEADTLVKENNRSLAIRTENSSLSLQDFTLRQQSDRSLLLRLKNMNIQAIKADTAEQDVMIGSFTLKSPSVYLDRDKKGLINWDGLIVQKEKKAAPAKSKTVKTVKVSEKSGDETPWSVGLKKFAMNSGSVTFQDKAIEKPAKFVLDRIGVNVRDISSKEKSRMHYRTSMRINKTGVFKTKGELVHTPLQQKGSIQLKNFQLADLNPYIQEQAFARIERGAFTFKIKEAYALSKSKPDLQVEGSVSVSDMIVNDTRDENVLLAFADITVNPFLFEHAPDKLFVEEVDVKALYVDVLIDANKTLNLAKLQKGDTQENNASAVSETTDANVSQKQPFPVKIVKISIDNSSAKFADFSLPLQFETYIHDFGGTVYAVSTLPEETSKVDMKGVVDQYGLAELNGRINSADPKYFTDLRLQFKNLALNSYSPYSAKFAGRKIDEGKLSLDLGYKINKSQLQGKNSIVIDKIKLGDKVESEDAVNLPLDLAIALIEDSDGVIDIDMPVEGDMQNPDFKYGATLWKAFGNMITNIATAPFRFLGSMLGIEGDKLQSIDFEPGMVELLPPEQEKLDALAKALKKRPKLMLGVTGEYDSKSDRYALQYAKALALVLSKIDAEKIKEDETLALPAAEEILNEHLGKKQLKAIRKRLRKEYTKNEEYKEHYYAALKEELIAMQEVSDEELTALASNRVKAIVTYLEVSQKVPADKLKIEAVKASDENAQEVVKNNLSIVVKE